jgi:Asp-tRNA(Asn)/Glu-tRNA(Gln) amidotransferase C subunit
MLERASVAALRLASRASAPLAAAHTFRRSLLPAPSTLPPNYRRIPAVSRMNFSLPRSSATSHLLAFCRPCWSLQSLFSAPPRNLTDAEIDHLLSLAQLHAQPSDMQQLKNHMQSFVAFLETVKGADCGGCDAMHALPCPPVAPTLDARDVASDNAAVDAVLCNASWKLESMFAVPKAIDD